MWLPARLEQQQQGLANRPTTPHRLSGGGSGGVPQSQTNVASAAAAAADDIDSAFAIPRHGMLQQRRRRQRRWSVQDVPSSMRHMITTKYIGFTANTVIADIDSGYRSRMSIC